MPNLSGSGGRSSGVNYATSAMFNRMYWAIQPNPTHFRQSAQYLATTYQADTGASGGSLKRMRGWQQGAFNLA